MVSNTVALFTVPSLNSLLKVIPLSCFGDLPRIKISAPAESNLDIPFSLVSGTSCLPSVENLAFWVEVDECFS